MILDDKLKQNTTPNDQLDFFKRQAAMQVKKKEAKQLEIKKYELEKQSMEKQMQDKENEYSRIKGGKYMKRDDFKQYAANLRGKNTNFKLMKKQLQEIKTEVKVLNNTKKIL